MTVTVQFGTLENDQCFGIEVEENCACNFPFNLTQVKLKQEAQRHTHSKKEKVETVMLLLKLLQSNLTRKMNVP